MERKLKIGDVVYLSEGFQVRTNVEAKFIYENVPFSDEIVCQKVDIGRLYLVDVSDKKDSLKKEFLERINNIFNSYGMSVDKEMVKQLVSATIAKYKNDYEYDSRHLIGDYVVTEVKDNYHVYCRKLQNGQYDEDGIVVDFYQDKLFSPTIMEDQISLVKEMRICFI
ncbi:hypothetical protein DW886_16650 [Enterocloster aldenensis]|uniref:hypothetical protein n=1 Tax=Enterocloster aldenensis TaxID=358742 RepID=UPI000E49B3DE|nr:hypothetical protein DW886_16650 [Enterocloster aldenensis]